MSRVLFVAVALGLAVCRVMAAYTDIPDGFDHCISTANPDQTDTDGNGAGDACTQRAGDARWKCCQVITAVRMGSWLPASLGACHATLMCVLISVGCEHSLPIAQQAMDGPPIPRW